MKVAIVLLAFMASSTQGLPSLKSSPGSYSPLWLRAFYDTYSSIQESAKDAFRRSRQIRPNVFTIMTDSSSSSSQGPVHHLVQVEPSPSYTGVLQQDSRDPQGITAVLNDRPIPAEQSIALGVNGNPKVILVSVKGKPQKVAAVFLENGKTPVVIQGVQDKLMPVSLQHIGGELFRVTTDGNPTVSPFYNLIKAIESSPGLYEVVENQNDDGETSKNEIGKVTSRSVASDRTLAIPSLNPTQIGQVIHAMQNGGAGQSLKPTQIAQVIHAMQDGGSQNVSPTQIAQVIHAMQNGGSSSTSPTQIAQVIHAMQSNTRGEQTLNPTQIAQVIHAMQDGGNDKSLNPTQISQVIHAMQSGTRDQSLNPHQVAQVIHAMQNQGQGSSLNPTQISQVIHAMQSSNKKKPALGPVEIAQILHSLRTVGDGKGLNPSQIAQIIGAIQGEPKPEPKPSLNPAQVAQVINVMQSTSRNKGLSPEQISQVIQATQESSIEDLKEPSLTSKVAQVIHAVQGNNNPLNPFQMSQVINAVQRINGDHTLDASRVAQAVHAVQVNNGGRILQPDQIYQVVNAVQSVGELGLQGKNPGEEEQSQSLSVAKILHVLQRNNHGVPLTPSQIEKVISAFNPKTSQELVAKQQGSGHQTIHATQKQKSHQLSPARLGQILYAIQRNTGRPLSASQMKKIIKAIQNGRGKNSLTPSHIAQILYALQTSRGTALHPTELAQILDALQKSGSSSQNIAAVQENSSTNSYQGIHAVQNSQGGALSNQRIHAVQNSNSPHTSQGIHAFQSGNNNGHQSIHAEQNVRNRNSLVQNQIAQAIHALQSASRGQVLSPAQISQVIDAVQSIHSDRRDGPSTTSQTVETTQTSDGITRGAQATRVHQSSGSSGAVKQSVHAKQHSTSQETNPTTEVYPSSLTTPRSSLKYDHWRTTTSEILSTHVITTTSSKIPPTPKSTFGASRPWYSRHKYPSTRRPSSSYTWYPFKRTSTTKGTTKAPQTTNQRNTAYAFGYKG